MNLNNVSKIISGDATVIISGRTEGGEHLDSLQSILRRSSDMDASSAKANRRIADSKQTLELRDLYQAKERLYDVSNRAAVLGVRVKMRDSEISVLKEKLADAEAQIETIKGEIIDLTRDAAEKARKIESYGDLEILFKQREEQNTLTVQNLLERINSLTKDLNSASELKFSYDIESGKLTYAGDSSEVDFEEASNLIHCLARFVPDKSITLDIKSMGQFSGIKSMEAVKDALEGIPLPDGLGDMWNSVKKGAKYIGGSMVGKWTPEIGAYQILQKEATQGKVDVANLKRAQTGAVNKATQEILNELVANNGKLTRATFDKYIDDFNNGCKNLEIQVPLINFVADSLNYKQTVEMLESRGVDAKRIMDSVAGTPQEYIIVPKGQLVSVPANSVNVDDSNILIWPCNLTFGSNLIEN